jgi:hypothetical protein
LWYGFQVIEVLVLSLTPAFLLVRLRRPRPSIRAMLRQPGTAAGLAVTSSDCQPKPKLVQLSVIRVPTPEADDETIKV